VRKIPQIESIRILAMAGIFLYHVWSVVPASGTENPFGPVFGVLLSQGYLGVFVFNMVSGFVLALPYMAPSGRPVPGYGEFMRRRFGRICPQYYLSLLLWTAVALAAGSMPLAALGISFAEHALFVHTLDPSRFFSLVPAFWWMGLLAQFYLACPLILRSMNRFGPGRTFAACCLLSYGGWRALIFLAGAFPESPLPMFEYMMTFNLPGRLPEFALGMYLSAVWKSHISIPDPTGRQHPDTGLPRYFAWAAPLFSVCAVAAACLFTHALPSPWRIMLLALACFSAAFALFSQPMMARLGRKPWAASFAAASYSFYLLHQPMLDYGAKIVGTRLAPFAAFCLLTVACAPLALALSKAQDRIAAKIL